MKNSGNEEVLVITDDDEHVWRLVNSALKNAGYGLIRASSNVRFDQNWERFKHVKSIIVDWECRLRHPSAVVEELQEAAGGNPELANKIVAILTTPLRDDIYCLGELDIWRVLRFQRGSHQLPKVQQDLRDHVAGTLVPDERAKLWKTLYSKVKDAATGNCDDLDQIEMQVKDLLASDPKSARFQDCLGLLALGRNQIEIAHRHWLQAIDLNPNYLPAYANLAKSYAAQNRLEESYVILKKINALSSHRVARLVEMGFIQLELRNMVAAESLFRNALQKNPRQPRALNGLAEIQFIKGDYAECKRLLALSTSGADVASRLNSMGIGLVRHGKFEQALEHYIHARNVLPDNDKGPLIFYNIALCYSKWGRKEEAKKFATLALIKNPRYEKPRQLIASLQLQDNFVGEVKPSPGHAPGASVA